MHPPYCYSETPCFVCIENAVCPYSNTISTKTEKGDKKKEIIISNL